MDKYEKAYKKMTDEYILSRTLVLFFLKMEYSRDLIQFRIREVFGASVFDKFLDKITTIVSNRTHIVDFIDDEDSWDTEEKAKEKAERLYQCMIEILGES